MVEADLGAEAVKGAVLHAHGDDTDAVALLVHDEVSGEVLDEEHRVEAQSLLPSMSNNLSLAAEQGRALKHVSTAPVRGEQQTWP